jgi:hypothetical protein
VCRTFRHSDPLITRIGPLTCTNHESDRTLRDGSLRMTISQALRARLRSERPSGTNPFGFGADALSLVFGHLQKSRREILLGSRSGASRRVRCDSRRCAHRFDDWSDEITNTRCLNLSRDARADILQQHPNVPEGRCDRSLARSAWESVPRKNRPVGYGMIGQASFLVLVVRAAVPIAWGLALRGGQRGKPRFGQSITLPEPMSQPRSRSDPKSGSYRRL